MLDVPYNTHRATCAALGFLDDDNEWDLVMSESAVYDTPSQIRDTFVVLLVFNKVGDPASLFDKHWRAMGEDFVHRLSSEEPTLSDEHLLVLVDINMRLEARDTNVKSFNLPMPLEEEMREVEEIDRRERR
jgi:ATP-dependent DNA helicase PIF1